MEEHLRPKELVGSSSLFRGTHNTSPFRGLCFFSLLFAAKKLGEETRFSFVTLAALVLGDATHYLIDVLAAASTSIK